MKKRIIIIIGVCIAITLVCVILINKKVIFSTTYSFGLGSRRVKIYSTGAVYDDLEIEEPNHKVKFKYLKKLSKDELTSLEDKIKSTSNKNELDDYVIELVYGVKEFDNNGNY